MLASVARTFFPAVAAAAPTLTHAATAGLTVALFLIGAGLSATTLRSVGWRALALAVALWLFVAATSLLVVTRIG